MQRVWSARGLKPHLVRTFKLSDDRRFDEKLIDVAGVYLDKHPRFHLHFIPTSSSWLNMVERWFRELTEKAIRRGVFKSVPDLIAAIEAYLQASNNDPKPFVWTGHGPRLAPDE